jgi:hypothetical protein
MSVFLCAETLPAGRRSAWLWRPKPDQPLTTPIQSVAPDMESADPGLSISSERMWGQAACLNAR